MTSPAIVCQCGDHMNHAQRVEWVRRRCAECAGQGIVQIRVTLHPEIKSLVIFEGWTEYQANMPEPEWGLTGKQGELT